MLLQMMKGVDPLEEAHAIKGFCQVFDGGVLVAWLLEMTKLLEQCSSDERNGAKVLGEAQPMEEGVVFWEDVLEFSTRLLRCIRWQQARMVGASVI